MLLKLDACHFIPFLETLLGNKGRVSYLVGGSHRQVGYYDLQIASLLHSTFSTRLEMGLTRPGLKSLKYGSML